jgi:cell division protein FtsQ
MPAAQRGGSRAEAKPRARTAPAPAKRGKAPAPARHVSPKLILACAAGALVLAGGAALATGGRGERIAAEIGSGFDNRFADAGFRLKTVHVQGASALATADNIKAAGVFKGQPLIGLDLERLRGRVKQVGWVKEARVVRLLPDTLVISVDERRQMAVWQHAGRSVVIDEHGQAIPEADAARFAALPLVVGAGAADHAGEILPLVAQRPKLMGRLEALVRVDDRRWDVRLKDGSLIQLPAAAEEDALSELERLDQRQRILDLGFERIDLRNPDIVAVRPRPAQSVPTAPAEPISGA